MFIKMKEVNGDNFINTWINGDHIESIQQYDLDPELIKIITRDRFYLVKDDIETIVAALNVKSFFGV